MTNHLTIKDEATYIELVFHDYKGILTTIRMNRSEHMDMYEVLEFFERCMRALGYPLDFNHNLTIERNIDE